METVNKAGCENRRTKGSLTIVGLGPGAAGHLSLETLKLLEERFVILRTEIHPTVAELKRRGISFVSCDAGWSTISFSRPPGKLTCVFRLSTLSQVLNLQFSAKQIERTFCMVRLYSVVAR